MEVKDDVLVLAGCSVVLVQRREPGASYWDWFDFLVKSDPRVELGLSRFDLYEAVSLKPWFEG